MCYALLDHGAYQSLFRLLHCAHEGTWNTDPISLKDAYSGFKWALKTKKTAKHWSEYYKLLHTTAFTPHILCKHSKATMSHPNRNGDKSTSNMLCHLEKCGTYTRYLRQYAESALDGQHVCAGWNRPSDPSPMTSEGLWEILLRILVSANLPFAFVENEEFRKMLHEAFPNCQIPRCQIMPDLLSVSAMGAASELRQELVANKSRVSLEMDV